MIQSGAEEIVDRCYLYQKLRRRYRWPAVAVIVNALVFMSLHMSNPGVTRLGLLQVFLIGILFSLIIYYWDSLWTVIWAHTAWNFSQSIVFGLPNSGIVSKYSVFKLEAASARDGIFYNTSFGVEGSLGANVMIAAVIVIVLIYGLATKRGERMDHWAEAEKRDAGKNHYWEAVILTIIMVAVIVGGYFTVKWVNDHAEEIQQVIEESQQAETAQEAEPAQGPETPAQEGQQDLAGFVTAADPVTVQQHHLDTNYHVNNAQYVAFATTQLPAGYRTNIFRAEYKMQSKLGDKIYPIVKATEEGYVVVLSDEEGNTKMVCEFMG